jgi:hypothetical protein
VKIGHDNKEKIPTFLSRHVGSSLWRNNQHNIFQTSFKKWLYLDEFKNILEK